MHIKSILLFVIAELHEDVRHTKLLSSFFLFIITIFINLKNTYLLARVVIGAKWALKKWMEVLTNLTKVCHDLYVESVIKIILPYCRRYFPDIY